jgi:phasin family protein
MYEDFLKMAQDSLKPVMKLAENNTALAVKLLNSQSVQTVEMLESNLAQVQVIAGAKDLNEAVDLQQKYVESMGEKMLGVAKENAATIETAVGEASKLFEGSMAEAQEQAKKAVEKISKEVNKAGNKAA